MKQMLRSIFNVKRIRPGHLVGSIFVVTTLLISQYAMTRSGGKTGQTEKPGSGNGCTCHCANANSSTSISVSTTGSTFEAGTTYTFTVSVSSSDANHTHAGFNAATWRGALNVGSDNTVQKIGDELTHTAPKALNATWTFTYTAPSTAGGDTIYVTCNAVNNDGTNGSGNCTDKWNHAAKYVMNITAPTRSLALTKSTVALGSLRLGQSRNDTLRIISNGDAAITINSSGMKTGTPFSASPTGSNRSLSVGTQEVNTITFSPTSRGAYVDTFVVNSNATTAADQRKTVLVTGTGLQAEFTGNNTFPFGNVKTGQTKDLVYTYQNTGNDTLFITNASLASTANFSIQGSPAATIPPSGTGSVTLRFAPSAKQNYSTNLTFTAQNSISTPTVAVSGTGVAPQLALLNQIQIGSVKLGATGSQNLDLENTGTDTLQITSVTISPEYQSQRFGISSGGTGPILPGAKNSVIVTYQPTSVRNDTAKIIVTSNDPQSPTRQVLVMGHGALPAMKVNGPDTIKFGDVRVGSSSTNSTVSIENTGEAELALTNITATPNVFTIVSPPNAVGGHGSVPLQVKFTPTVAGDVSGMVTITGDDSNFPRDTVYITARGTVSQFDTPAEINFGDRKIQTSRDSTFYLRNLGTASLTIKSYSVSGPAGVFQAIDTSKHSIGAKDSIAVKVRFNALAELSYTGSLVVTTTETSGATRTINLRGRGIDSKLILSESSYDFGEVDTGKTASHDFIVTNTGSLPVAINQLDLTGTGVSAYASAHSSLPHTLNTNDTLLVTVLFTPTTAGSLEASLGVVPGSGSSFNVPLHGTGKVQPSGSVRDARLVIPFHLSPNPSHGNVTASFETATEDKMGISIFSSDGRLVNSIAPVDLPAGAHELRLDTDVLASGEYIVRLTDHKGRFIEQRLVIIR